MKKVSIFLLSAIALFSLNQVNASTLKTPVVSEINSSIKNLEAPFITGFTEANTEVLVYIDKEYVGTAPSENINKSLYSFAFYIERLPATGNHELFLIAKNKISGILSPQTRIYEIYINNNIEAPEIKEFDGSTLRGKVESGNLIHVYVDGKYDGSTSVLNNKKGVVEFEYNFKSTLKSDKSDIYVTATDLAGRVSGRSNIIKSAISSLPAPTITKVKLYNVNKNEVSGVSFNDTKIEIYIDNKLEGTVDVANSKNGTGIFSFRSVRPLTAGLHTIYAKAIDEKGRVSLKSGSKTLEVLNTPRITEKAVEEKSENKTPVVVLGEDNVDATTENNEDTNFQPTEDVQNIINGSSEEAGATSSGSLDESNNKQSKLKLNLIIFLAFLVAVIAWIIWVNKELVKEREETEDENIE